MPSFRKLVSGFRRVVIQAGDTLQAIAAREMGDAAAWVDLANLNNLIPPYIGATLADASARVLLPGQTILVPSPAPEATAVVDPDSVFGADIALVNGRLGPDAGGDLATVAGAPNLSQALGHAVATHQGELLFHPDYGCRIHELLGGKAFSSIDRLGAAFVQATLRSDPRVTAASAKAEITGDYLAVAGTAMTADGKRIPVGLTRGVKG